MIRAQRVMSALAIAALSATILSVPAHADNTSYYVDSRAGCSDSFTTTSATQPWCSFANLNSRTLGPGDRVLLARGATWSQALTLQGTGTAASPIQLDAYGTGNRPRILYSANTNSVGVKLTNPSYWAVRNLEINGQGATQKLVRGILVVYSGANGIGNAGLTFSNLYLHHNQFGLAIEGTSALTASQWSLKGLTMTNIEGTHNETSIAFTQHNQSAPQFIQDAVLSGLFLHNDDGAGPVIYRGCDNSLTLQDMSNVTVMNSVISDAGACYRPTGTTGVYLGAVVGANIVNNIIVNTNQTSSPDQTGLNYEGWTNNVAVRGNYIGGNVRWGIGVQAIHDEATGGANKNASIQSNAIVDNGQPPIATLGSASLPTGAISDNLWKGTQFLATQSGGTFDGFTITNNAGPAVGDRVWYAARDYATGQGVYGWNYQYSSDGGTTWSGLTYFASTDNWRTSATATIPMLSKWNWHPAGPTTALVAKAWTAPRSGTVSIRGQAVKGVVGGDGVRVQITRNSTPVLPQILLGGSDRVGVATTVNNLAVQAGDVIRFIVDPGGAGANSYDTVSWSPVVAYLN